MRLWWEWYRWVHQLRPACSRLRTFLWLVIALAGICCRPDRLGVTSLVRALRLSADAYHRLLHMFHSPAIQLELLTTLWVRLVLKMFRPLQVGSRLVCLADGIKVPKEGKKMPAVRSLHQSSDNNAKPSFIMGHSFQALSLLVHGAGGHVAAVPLTARIHEGLVWSNRDKRTLLDKMVLLFLTVTNAWQRSSILVADAYYASKKVIEPLLADHHHLVTRVRVSTVGFRPAPTPRVRRRGRPRIYGKKLPLRDLAADRSAFVTAPSPVYGDVGVELEYRTIELLWRPIGKLVQFVIVHHPRRGTIFLMTTDTDMKPLDVIALYGHRFKIEVGFRQATQVIGSYAYHFWMMDMTPIRRRSKNQYMHMKTADYRDHVRRKLGAYHRYVQSACIVQGMLIHLALNCGAEVWRQFRSWLRTMNPDQPPSELVVAMALRETVPDFLADPAGDRQLRKLIREYSAPRNTRVLARTA